jgi:hypothetical protein
MWAGETWHSAGGPFLEGFWEQRLEKKILFGHARGNITYCSRKLHTEKLHSLYRQTVSWFLPLVVGLFSRMRVLDPRRAREGFVVDIVELEYVLLCLPRVFLHTIIPPLLRTKLSVFHLSNRYSRWVALLQTYPLPNILWVHNSRMNLNLASSWT